MTDAKQARINNKSRLSVIAVVLITQTITAMTRSMNVNVHIVSHIKEKFVHAENETQAQAQQLADIDDDIGKVPIMCPPA